MNMQSAPVPFFGSERLHTHYNWNERSVMPAGWTQGVNTASLIAAMGGPALLSVHRETPFCPEPSAYPISAATDPREQMQMVWDAAQYEIARRTGDAVRDDSFGKFFTGPRFTSGTVLMDPSVLTKAKAGQNCHCTQVTGGVPLNDTVYARIRYPTD